MESFVMCFGHFLEEAHAHAERETRKQMVWRGGASNPRPPAHETILSFFYESGKIVYNA